jgi:hypothetical protein
MAQLFLHSNTQRTQVGALRSATQQPEPTVCLRVGGHDWWKLVVNQCKAYLASAPLRYGDGTGNGLLGQR